jgi:ATP-dependent helicase/DNAse subunit B
VAQIWPGGQALEQALSRAAEAAAGGLLLGGGELYTFQGKNALLPLLWGQLPPHKRQAAPLAELAGPLLVQEIVRSLGRKEPVLAGLSQGRRFPHRLWRLLVGLKAAGLTPEHIQRLEGPGAARRRALETVFRAYRDALEQRALADEADQLAALEKHLDQGGHLPSLAKWRRLEVKQALWLRPAELRLLAALSRCVPVRVEFALAPPLNASQQIFGLLEDTARALERGGGEIEVAWADLEGEGGHLSRLALSAWDGAEASPAAGQALELVRAPGVYAEVEALVGRARELVDSGVPAHRVVMVFPDLSLYGQMAADVAGRLGLPLSFRRPEPLAGAPLVQAFMELLSLPGRGYPRTELARVWDSPYLGPCLARLLDAPQPRGAARLLAQAGYVDARETSAHDWLLAARNRARPDDGPRLAELARACGALARWLAPLDQAQSLEQYASQVLDMLQDLDPGRELAQGRGVGREASLALARDLNALAGLGRALAGLREAARQVEVNGSLSPGRLHALLGQALEQHDAGSAAGARGGVRVLRLEDAQGLEPDYLLAGGLNLEEFPARPRNLRLLGGEERVALGQQAGLPVWRTEEQEFGGQVLRLLLLLASARQGAMLACSAADLNGAPRSPSLFLSQMAASLGRQDELAAPAGGVYGETPPLDQCQESRSLWSALSRDLMRPRAAPPKDAPLAQAVLHSLAQRPGNAARWRSLAGRAAVEQDRLRLEVLGQEARQELAGPFSGLLAHGAARALLQAILAQPQRRRLSPTSLESYAACPMRWFLERVLGLAEAKEPSWGLASQDEGQWVHAALARFFAPGEYDPSWDESQQRRRLEDCLEAARQELEAQGRAGHSLVQQARGSVLSRTLAQVVAREMAEMPPFRPSQVEAKFGYEDEGLEVAVGEADSLFLYGRLDRLDQKRGALRVVDYKHASQKKAIGDPVKKDNLGVSAFQMLVYLAAARRLWGAPDDELTARVAPTRKMEFKPGVLKLLPGDGLLAENPEQRRRLSREGQANLFNAVAEIWQRIQAGDFLAEPEQRLCEFCSLGGVCRARRDPAAALGEEAP